MNFLIIYNTPHKQNLIEIDKLIQDFEIFQRINESSWIVHSENSATLIKNELSNRMGISDSILVFEITRKWAVANAIDLGDWLEHNQ
ncbi:hypothetical protein EC844_11753 [Acinetobacter calcoaceticus]|uniref:SinR family protein n=1 Tax=Acinetobacter calcoaceticus TaxID=471 RepID=A0A4R1XKI0_ACICA|nr:hypothetical protein EC844_11753 [Acinetobacter calcoaceticus]